MASADDASNRELEARSAESITRQARQWLLRRRMYRLSIFGSSTAPVARGVVVHAWPSVSLIQRRWRAHRFRTHWNGMLRVLSARYGGADGTDSNNGDASDGGLYSAAMLLRRERIWRDDRLQDALERAWTAVASATALRIFSAAAPEGGNVCMTWNEYYEMSRRLAVALCAKLKVGSAYDMACADFAHDTRDWPDPTTPLFERTLDKETFARSWFELADMHTTEVDAGLFERFVDVTARTIVRQDLYGVFMLRPDAEILAILAAKPAERRKMLATARLARNADGTERRPFAHAYHTATSASVAHRAARCKAPPTERGKPASRRASGPLEATAASASSSARTSLHVSPKPTPLPSLRPSRRSSLTLACAAPLVAPGVVGPPVSPSPSSRWPSRPPSPAPAHPAQ